MRVSSSLRATSDDDGGSPKRTAMSKPSAELIARDQFE